MTRIGSLAGNRTFLVAALCLATAWSVLIAVQHLEGRPSPMLDRAEAQLTDLRFLLIGPRPPPADVVIVAIDDETIRDAQAYPLPRSTLARLVNALVELEPKVIALDILFLENGPPEADRSLADALTRSRSAIAAAGLFGPRSGEQSHEFRHAVPSVDRVLWPVQHLRDAAAVGLVNVAVDPSGTPRHIPLILRSGDDVLSSFPLRVATLASGTNPILERNRIIVGDRAIRTDLGYHLPINFFGPRGSIKTISARAVLSGEVERDQIEGRLVLVGATAVGSGDTFATPFDSVLPGVDVLATAVAHVVTGDNLIRDHIVRRIDAGVAVVLPIVTILLMTARRTAAAFALIGLVWTAWITLTVFGFSRGFWFSMSVPLASALPAASLYGLARLWRDRLVATDMAVVQETFRRFHAPLLGQRLAADSHFLENPVQQNGAVLFIDLSRFSSVSEQLGPNASRNLLKQFHSLVEEEVTLEGGVVATFMGDGAMIIFGLPEADPDDSCRAVRAAIALATATQSWIQGLPEPLGTMLGVRVGAHCGPVVMSRLGADTHQQITATGDTVNVASRLLEIAAQGNAAVAVSASLIQAAGDACSAFAETLGSPKTVDIRGRTGELVVQLWSPNTKPNDPSRCRTHKVLWPP